MILICPADFLAIYFKCEPEVSLADDRVSCILKFDRKFRRERVLETNDCDMRGRQESLL